MSARVRRVGTRRSARALSRADCGARASGHSRAHWRVCYGSVTEPLIEAEAGKFDILLLNPWVVFPDGEWEAWDLGTRPRGAYWYRSFWELMEAQNVAFVVPKTRRGPSS